MFDRQGWKFVARDALALYASSYLLRILSLEILGLPEKPSALAQLSASVLSFLFWVLCFGVVAFYARNEVWKHLIAVSVLLYVASVVRSIVSLYTQVPELNQILVITVVTLPLIHYSITASLGGYLGLKFKKRGKD